MRTLPAMAVAGLAAALAGTAIAASPKSHVMNVPLPDGSVARVEYVGDVAPKVTVDPAPLERGWAPGAFPSFAGFDQMMRQMDRQTQEIMRQVQQMKVAPGLNVAGFGGLSSGANSVSVVSVTNGGGTCTRTTQVVSQGAGKPPKVTSSVNGDCGPAGQSAPRPSTGAAPINPT